MLTLQEILKYQNPYIIQRYERDFYNNQLSADEALKELIKYLWLSKNHALDRKTYPDRVSLQFMCSMHPEMREIDDMWHTFILFTKDYAQFCIHYFGEFMHHVPKTSDTQIQPHEFETEFTRYLTYVYEKLGEETVCKWFSTYL